MSALSRHAISKADTVEAHANDFSNRAKRREDIRHKALYFVLETRLEDAMENLEESRSKHSPGIQVPVHTR